MNKRYPSLAQLQASRRNGSRSRGPKTQQGRDAVKLNALQHGLAAKTTLFPGESQERYQYLLGELQKDHAPATLTEALLIEHLANAAWKLRRTLAYEKAIMSKEIQDAPPADSAETQAALTWADSRRLRLVARYEAAQQRVFRANLHDLFTCQAVRECGYQNSASESQEAPENQQHPAENTILPNEPGTLETPAKENATP